MSQSCNRWLLPAGVLAVVFLAILTVWLARYSSDPLDVLPASLPEVDARRIYQEKFLRENDLLIVLRGPKGSTNLQEEAERLAEQMRKRFPALRDGIQSQYPWEKDPASVGELVAYTWVNAPEPDLAALADRLSSTSQREQTIQDSLETLATAFTLDAEVAQLLVDPLRLGNVPGLPQDSLLLQEGLGFAGAGLRVLQVDIKGDRNDVKLMRRWMTDLRLALNEDLPEGMSWEFAGWGPYLLEITKSMRKELRVSAIFTFSVVLLLFLLVYRTALPLLTLAITLALTALGTILLGDLIYGSLNAISIGFAAILIALVVDYSVIVYQDLTEAEPHHHSIRGPVLWAAISTAIVFLALNLSIIPGIAQLGTLVALGLLLGALISLTYFRRITAEAARRSPPRDLGQIALSPRKAVRYGLVLALAGALWCGIRGVPQLDTSPDTMLPTHAKSVEKYEALREKLSDLPSEPLTLLFQGTSPAETVGAMQTWQARLQAEIPQAVLAEPSAIWPSPAVLSPKKREALSTIAEAAPGIREDLSAEFEADALAFADRALEYWEGASRSQITPLPLGEVGVWALQSTVHISREDGFVAKGILSYPAVWPEEVIALIQQWADADPHTTLLGWDHLGSTMEELLQHDSRWVIFPSILALILVLWCIYRSVLPVLLSLATLGVSALIFLGLMRLAGLSWNPVSLMAIPLFLGAGLDYTIHLQLALRRVDGDLSLVSRTLGKALLVCGCSTAAGFGSLAWSQHPGLASLGVTCSLGVLSIMAVSLTLLPGWWCGAQAAVARKSSSTR